MYGNWKYDTANNYEKDERQFIMEHFPKFNVRNWIYNTKFAKRRTNKIKRKVNKQYCKYFEEEKPEPGKKLTTESWIL